MSQSSEPLVSVIIPTYKGEDFIIETLKSVLQQTYDAIEIIIIDDGSPDNVGALVENYHPKIKLFRQENQGIAGARNTGLKLANGEFICFLDHDDIWHPEKVSSQMKIFETHPNVGVVYGNYVEWYEGKYDFPQAHLSSEKQDSGLSGFIYHRLLEKNYLQFSTAMMRKSVLDEVGKLNVDMPPGDDWDLNIRMSRITQFFKQSDYVALYRIHIRQTSAKTPPRNYASEFRHQFINEYGYSGPDGQCADKNELKKRFFKSDFDFAYAHYIGGNYAYAGKLFFDVVKAHPFKVKMYLHAARCYLFALVKPKTKQPHE